MARDGRTDRGVPRGPRGPKKEEGDDDNEKGKSDEDNENEDDDDIEIGLNKNVTMYILCWASGYIYNVFATCNVVCHVHWG